MEKNELEYGKDVKTQNYEFCAIFELWKFPTMSFGITSMWG